MPITRQQIELVSKILLTHTKSPDPDGFTAKFYKHLKNQYQFSYILPKK